MPFDEYSGLAVSVDGLVKRGPEAVVSVWDHGLLYGDGCFEGMRVRDGLLFRPWDHLDRLMRSARALALNVPATGDQILSTVAEVVAANELDDAHVRVVLTRGAGAPGLDPRRATNPSLIVFAYPFPPLLGERPLRLIISSIARKAPRSVDAHVKSLNYLDGILAKQQANAAGADDALMLDDSGVIAEASSANVFAVRAGIVITPTTRAALPGVTRRTVIEILRNSSVVVVERDLTWGELYAADECFLTGTGAGIVPVAAVDGRELPEAPGPLTRLAQDAYAYAVADASQTLDVGKSRASL